MEFIFSPTSHLLPACREPLLEVTTTVARLCSLSSWICVISSEAHTLPNQLY